MSDSTTPFQSTTAELIRSFVRVTYLGDEEAAVWLLAAADTIERLTRERDAIARLCYRKVETEDLDRETYYRLAILHLCLGPETYDTEPEAVAAVRRLAGLDAEDRL